MSGDEKDAPDCSKMVEEEVALRSTHEKVLEEDLFKALRVLDYHGYILGTCVQTQ